MKNFQRHPVKIVEGGVEYLIFPILYFGSVIQLIIIKFEIQNTKMRKTFLFSIILLTLVSCNKDKYTTIPHLKFESASKKSYSSGDIIKFTLSFTDAEGDLTDSIYVEKFEPKCVASRFKQYYKFPVFPTGKNQSGEILITYGYNVASYPPILGPQCNRNDTAVFRFFIQDKAKNKSDTVTSGQIVLIK
jgi:hypothetical protein